jgi:hypothetical protein
MLSYIDQSNRPQGCGGSEPKMEGRRSLTARVDVELNVVNAISFIVVIFCDNNRSDHVPAHVFQRVLEPTVEDGVDAVQRGVAPEMKTEIWITFEKMPKLSRSCSSKYEGGETESTGKKLTSRIPICTHLL